MSGTKDEAVLITGAGGALAQQVVSRLKGKHNIVVVDVRHRPSIGSDIPSYKMDFDKRAFEDIFKKHNIKSVIHLGRIGPQQSTLANRYNANVLGTQKLLDFCVKYKVTNTLILSTYHVYGAHAYNPALIEEDAPLKAAGITMNLVDSVELENLCNIYLWKNPELNITILRPCNIAGPGINNTMSQLLIGKNAPWLVGFSPMMQFIHIEDMSDAIVSAFEKNIAGIYNVAPSDCVSYSKALELSNCRKIPIAPLPASLPKTFSRVTAWRKFPVHLVDFFKYPVIIDGKRFKEAFDFEPRYSLEEIFSYYREMKG
jgi:UDP-glucose 4-epimerase